MTTPSELPLSLTAQTYEMLEYFAGPQALYPDDTPQSLAMGVLWRWSKRLDKTLVNPDRYGGGTHYLTLHPDHDLFEQLTAHGRDQAMSAVVLASAIVNDWGAGLFWKREYGKLT